MISKDYFTRRPDASLYAYYSTPRDIRKKYKILILEEIEKSENATCNELEILLNLTHQTVSARITELKKENRIYDTGRRRLTMNGRPARVYAITQF